MRLDLHIHTTASDGAWSAAEVARAAARGGLDVIAVTDHDTAAGVAPALEAGRALDVQVLSGIEVSSTHERRDVHVLGYGMDPEVPALVRYAERASRRREERMREMIRRLARQGIDVDFREVEDAAGPDRVNIARPHLARVLASRGFASSVVDAFNTLIGDGHPAFVPTGLLGPADAVGLVLEAGGIPVWAHPPGDLIDSLLPTLVSAGLRGLEVYRPSHARPDVLRLERICHTAGLLMTGGSDWHTPDSGAALGDFFVSGDEVERFLEEVGI
ncbi:MAG TPA: PHP domain-containing protein [Longimicrobiales bacterium]|nr:PHP domain-containing protein [Longimicrobiales bacterium]